MPPGSCNRIKQYIALGGAALWLGAAPVFAVGASSDADARILKLEEQVRLLTRELQALKKERQAVKTDTSKAAVAGKAVAAEEKGVTIALNPAPKISSADDRNVFQPIGQLHIDAALFNDDKADHPDGANIRRARLGFKGKIEEDWRYQLEFDFAKEDVGFKNVYMAYTGLAPAELRIGHYKPPFMLEEQTSTNHVTFVERALPALAFSTEEILGAGGGVYGDGWTLAAGLFNDDAGTIGTDDEAYALIGRATYAPLHQGEKTVHLGASGMFRAPDQGSDSLRFRSKAENSLMSLQAVDTGAIANVDGALLYGLEAAAGWRSLRAQGEYIAAAVERKTLGDLDFNGWYALASWVMTGEAQSYDAKAGKFGRIIPKQPFDIKKGGSGAWEIALRRSFLDLSDKDIVGGEISDWTFGVNWHVNANVRLMANYIVTDVNGDAVTPDDNPQSVLLRAQMDF